MKKARILIMTVIIFAGFLPGIAQFKQLATGNTFDEPILGVSKLIQMKNGNTFYVHIEKNRGIDLRIYDADHKEKVATSVDPAFGKLRAGTFQAAFEVKGDAVLFISEYIDNAPVLYRLIFDGNTGKLKEEKTIALCVRHGGMLATGMIDAFNVKKDPVDENYAVEGYNIFEDDKDKRLEIIQYGDDNNETNRSFLVTGDNDDYKFFVYMDMQVLNADKVNIFLYNGKEKYFYNTKKGRMVMASIDKKASKITYTPVSLPEGIKFSRCSTQYIPKTKKLYLMLLELNERDRNNYDVYLTKINTLTNAMETKLVIDVDEKINDKYKEKFSLRKNYMGMFRSFYVNEDESYTVVYEDEFSRTSAGSFSFTNSSTTSYYTGKIMIMNYNSQGEVLSGYVVPKLFDVNQYGNYKSFLYVDAPRHKYMLINDTERNNDAKNESM